MISALRAQTAPDSITPEGLGAILQRIADLIAAFSQIDVSTETDLVARVTAAEGNASTALTAAQGAAAAAAANVIDTFEYTQGSSTVLTLTLKQHGHNAIEIDLPGASATYAGLLTATDKSHLDAAYNKRLKQLSTSSTDSTVKFNYKCEDDTVKEVTLVGATSLAAGLMTAEDKAKLDSLSTTVNTLQTLANTLGSKKADKELNGTMDMLALSQWPRHIIKSATPGFSNVEGEIYLMAGMASFDPVTLQVLIGNVRYDLGQPNEFMVYFAKDTRKFYTWDKTQQVMVEV